MANPEAFGSFCLCLGMMEGMSLDAEDDLFSSDVEGGHNVENIMLCSFEHHGCSPLLQGFLHDEELCKSGSDLSLALDVIFPCED